VSRRIARKTGALGFSVSCTSTVTLKLLSLPPAERVCGGEALLFSELLLEDVRWKITWSEEHAFVLSMFVCVVVCVHVCMYVYRESLYQREFVSERVRIRESSYQREFVGTTAAGVPTEQGRTHTHTHTHTYTHTHTPQQQRQHQQGARTEGQTGQTGRGEESGALVRFKRPKLDQPRCHHRRQVRPGPPRVHANRM
jgi:hypothetical protein